MPESNPLELSTQTTSDCAAPNLDRSDEFIVRFWGVRGSIPTPGMETARYGGNTACVEMQMAGKRLIFDGGTGLRVLGKNLQQQMPLEAHLFFTHSHWDRIQGFPFFMPAFMPGNCFHIYGAIGPNGASIKQRLSEQMLRPNFPVPLQVMQSELKFYDIAPGSIVTLDDVTIETISLNRPNSALGYRVTWNGHSVVYATDTEHASADQSLLYLADQADLLIYDAAYADHNYYDSESSEASKSLETWKAGIKAVTTAQAQKIVMFHHDPSHEDDFLDRIEADVRMLFPNVCLAREGMVLKVK